MKQKNMTYGFTLIEVLIAFIILSIGLLAIVSLQASSKQNTHQAMQRSLAVSYAESIAERVRANPAAILTYVNHPTIGARQNVQEPNPNCANTFCQPAQIAAHDMWVFEQKLQGAAATITEDDVTTSTTGLISPLVCMNFAPRAGLVRTGTLSVRIQWQGLASISDPVTAAADVCNGGADAGTDNFRRQIVVNTYLIDEMEL